MPTLAECIHNPDLRDLAGQLDASGDWSDPLKVGAPLTNALHQIESLKRRVADLEANRNCCNPSLDQALNSGDGTYRP